MSQEKKTIFCLGTNHRTADIALRERFYLNSEDIVLNLSGAARRYGFSELAILSTCNRLELMGVAPVDLLSEDRLYQCLGDLLTLKHESTPPNWQKATYLYIGREAITHIFSVASSLDSMIVGETQITGQFKDSFAAAEEAGSTGPILTRLKHEALATTKKVRTKTTIGEKPVSISHAAIDLARVVFGDLSKNRIGILGAGEMSRVACQHLISTGVRDLYVINRSVDRAQALCDKLGHGEAWPMQDLEALMPKIDVLFSATAAPDLVISSEMVTRAQAQRSRRDLILVDIALPRDIDPMCSDIDGVYLFDIDDLKQVVDRNIEARNEAAVEAKTIIAQSVDNFLKWIETTSIKPAISEFRRYLKDLFAQERDRSLSKSLFEGLSEAQRAGIQQMLDSIANKLTADASVSVKSPPDGLPKEQLAFALSTLFRPKDVVENKEHVEDSNTGEQTRHVAGRIRS